MFTSNRSTRHLVALVAAVAIGGAACTPSAPPVDPDPFPAEAAYNNCPGSGCIRIAEIDSSGRTVKFRGETRYMASPSQWILTVHRGSQVVATADSLYLDSNRYDVDLGALPAGGAYRMKVVAGTPQGDQLLYKYFQTGPDVTATPTATNVSLAFNMPVAVKATVQIRKTDGTLVSDLSAVGGPSASHTIVSPATLDPTTGYTYQVNAIDAQGRIYVRTGSFVTRNVRLEVQMAGLQITNDSDLSGAGELRAQLHVGSVKPWIWNATKSVDSGQYFAITTTAALPSAVRSVPIHVVVADDDCPVIGSICTFGTGELGIGSGSVTGEGEWATATTIATLPNTTTTTQWTNFISSTEGPVGFIATGSYRWVMV